MLRFPLRARALLVLVACGLAGGCGRTVDDRDGAGDGGEGGAGGAAPDTWRIPDCEALATVDGVPVFDVPREFGGLAALEEPNVLLAAGYTLERSTDGGCTWEVLDEADFGETYQWIVARRGGGAYVEGGGHALARVDGTAITALNVPPPAPAGALPHGTRFAVDPSDGDHLLAFRRGDSMLFRSEDGATTWSQVGPAPEDAGGATIHPRDRDDVVVRDGLGTMRTRDGGVTWSRSTFLVDGAPVEAPAGHLVRSTVDPDVLQLKGGGPDTLDDRDFPPIGVYRSRDGGTTFSWEGTLPHGRAFASAAAPDALWIATPTYEREFMNPGLELTHVVDGVERDRVAIPAASEVLTRSPAGALYVARASTDI